MSDILSYERAKEDMMNNLRNRILDALEFILEYEGTKDLDNLLDKIPMSKYEYNNIDKLDESECIDLENRLINYRDKLCNDEEYYIEEMIHSSNCPTETWRHTNG